MSTKQYTADYDFSIELFNVTGLLNDGHTRWFPDCYRTFQNLLPAPIISLLKDGKEDVYVVPDLLEFIPLVGAGYTAFLQKIGFNWQRLAGAKVLEIQGVPYVVRTRRDVETDEVTEHLTMLTPSRGRYRATTLVRADLRIIVATYRTEYRSR